MYERSAVLQSAEGKAAERDSPARSMSSERHVALTQFAADIAASPRMAAQRRQIGSLPVRTPGKKEKVPVQGKFDAAARLGTPEKTPVQRAGQGEGVPHETPLQRKADRQAHGGGLPAQLKHGIERLSGYSMDDVKVHYNSSQPAQLQAHAYAQGSDIHIAPGQERHLAHEAWHVVQQKQGRVRPTMQMKDGVPVNDDMGLEHEADVMGARVVQTMGAQSTRPDSASWIPMNTVQARKAQIFGGAGRGHHTMQFARLNIRADGTISGVSNFPSRPPSNVRGTQGQHFTAYVVFEDTILAKVKDRAPGDAVIALKGYLDEILTLPGMQQSNVKNLTDAIKYWSDQLEKLSKVKAINPKTIGDIIDYILCIRNMVPGTARRGKGGGHDEAGSSGRLELVETTLRRGEWENTWVAATIADQCRALVWQLLDYQPADPTDDQEEAAIAKVIITHFKSIVSAYPNLDAWLNHRGAYYTSYLEAHRNNAGMPLLKVGQPQLTRIFELVGAGM
ncbi:DUF4157 domain-containing protein [Paraburkholderia sp. J67]|uniref:eCIS core domain-containing protein n=1 Tax=Paraburkholderia sp. J67 TaxID=2805435 RepID=UPI002ABE9EC0|nr:DUF4157 domain-containing protein [Paraburkholderia sp. J67]